MVRMIQILFPSTGLQDEVVDITEKKKEFYREKQTRAV